jgi:hypothetical protein
MSTIITRFDDLSPEVILCILDFLSTADRYKSFFDYDYRLHVLVKKRTEFSRKDLNADILRFSTLHSWYKHLSFDDGGSLFFIVPTQGQQPRYHFDPRIADSNGLHWTFLRGGKETAIANEQVRAIITRYPFRLNPFFYHQEYKSDERSSSSSSRSFYGGDLILMVARSNIKPWLNTNYPEYAEKIFSCSNKDLIPIFDGEWLKVTAAINKVAVQIWNELKELDDINPLEIEFQD